jgi:hypothetical protein
MKKKREEHTIGKESEATEMMKGLEGEREREREGRCCFWERAGVRVRDR